MTLFWTDGYRCVNNVWKMFFVLLKDCLKLFCFGKRETFLTVYISVESVGVWRNVLWADESQLLMWQEFYKDGCALPVRVRHAGVTEGKNKCK